MTRVYCSKLCKMASIRAIKKLVLWIIGFGFTGFLLVVFFQHTSNPDKTKAAVQGYHINHKNRARIPSVARRSKSYVDFPMKHYNGNESKVFKVLFWTSFKPASAKGRTDFNFRNCEYNNCVTTSDKADIATSDALLFHASHMTDEFPKMHDPDQKWIFQMRESPANQPSYEKYNGLFNATWSYDRHSDIMINHTHGVRGRGYYVKRSQDDIPKTKIIDYAKGRSKLAVWFVSNCHAKSKRLNYVRHLQEYMDVDIYGRCGNLRCDKNDTTCTTMVSKTYKFYLSFENSLCDDYATEKLWKPIYMEVVPVVLGALDYASILPPHSYVDVKDFASPKDLAAHLLKVGRNDKLYNSYFAWKQTYKLVTLPPAECNLCQYLNEARGVRKVYDRLDLFWDKETKCYPPTVFYKSIESSAWT